MVHDVDQTQTRNMQVLQNAGTGKFFGDEADGNKTQTIRYDDKNLEDAGVRYIRQ